VSVYVPLVLEAVERLEAEILRIHHNVRAIAAWPTDSAAEITSIRAAIRRACESIRGIQNQVLVRTDVPPSDALRASSLRARAIVLSVQLSEMERAARGLAGSPMAGRFPDVWAFKDYLLGEIGRINAQWITESKRAGNAGTPFDGAILERAEAAYRSLGQDQDVAIFVAWALSSESYALREASRVIAALLGIGLASEADVEPTRIEVPSLPTLLAHAGSRTKEVK
jgi:hypothetical protein